VFSDGLLGSIASAKGDLSGVVQTLIGLWVVVMGLNFVKDMVDDHSKRKRGDYGSRDHYRYRTRRME